MSILCPGFFERLARALQVGPVGTRNDVKIVEFHVIATRVVIPAEEPRVRGNVDAALAQKVANLGTVGHGCKQPGVGPTPAPPASSAVMRRLVGVIQTARSV